ncbi:hypothetical protein EUGRSUZ_H04670 [Eucalyptus grandis]|uniref:Uncharacterized protein n=2 Tax=Eucalyptus grandis TaxID=71139 RepID=A0A059B708_EUCGR|nr:hypothetical protein EUGRSUZ_H04670 [Eucalyptus grandis]
MYPNCTPSKKSLGKEFLFLFFCKSFFYLLANPMNRNRIITSRSRQKCVMKVNGAIPHALLHLSSHVRFQL